MRSSQLLIIKRKAIIHINKYLHILLNVPIKVKDYQEWLFRVIKNAFIDNLSYVTQSLNENGYTPE